MKPLAITRANYNKEVKRSDKPVLMIFSATWCPTCRMQAPVMNQLAGEIDDVKIVSVDMDTEQKLAEQFVITAIPTIVFIKDEKIHKLDVGYRKKEELLKLIGH